MPKLITNNQPEIPGYAVKSFCGKGAYGEFWLAEESKTGEV